uniref:4-coumarate--CoA ligase-like 7 n=1 Tax=Ananas comosus var. bracteatus TaxID=296719 RepID=A0A6V7NN06_ANACO|nr:unnamed protein product [Ananas comosus var. bracteatus]
MVKAGEEASSYGLPALRRVVCGGAPLHVAAARRFQSRFPRVELQQGYGSTEAGGISRMINPEECCHLRSAGRLAQKVEVKIVDHVTGNILSVGQKGELWVRGPALMKVDRLKELIKYKAYQVPPAELEHVLQSSPKILDAAVIPYPHEEAGQIPVALVVRQPGCDISETEVMDYVAQQVAPYKKIRKSYGNRESPAGLILLSHGGRSSTTTAVSAGRRPTQRLLRGDEDLPQPPPHRPLPPPSLPLSFPSFAFSFLPSSPLPSHPALIDAANGDAISYPELLSQIRSLAAALRSTGAVSKGDVAFILSPPRLDVPVLYLALLSLGVVVSPANPVSTSPEISRLVGLSRPSVAFATSSTAHKLPSNLPTILLDSPRFRSFLQISESYPQWRPL